MTATLVRRTAHGGLPIPDPRRMDGATELSVHRPSGRRCDSSVGSFSRPAAQECRRFRTENHAEVLAAQIEERVATIRPVRHTSISTRVLSSTKPHLSMSRGAPRSRAKYVPKQQERSCAPAVFFSLGRLPVIGEVDVAKQASRDRCLPVRRRVPLSGRCPAGCGGGD